MAKDDAKARQQRVFDHSAFEELSSCNFMIYSLSDDHEDMYEETLDWGWSKRLWRAFPLKLSPHASRLVLPFLCKSLSIPRR